MTPRTRPVAKPNAASVPPEVRADIEAGRAEIERGEGRELTPEEMKHWAETGEWPESSA